MKRIIYIFLFINFISVYYSKEVDNKENPLYIKTLSKNLKPYRYFLKSAEVFSGKSLNSGVLGYESKHTLNEANKEFSKFPWDTFSYTCPFVGDDDYCKFEVDYNEDIIDIPYIEYNGQRFNCNVDSTWSTQLICLLSREVFEPSSEGREYVITIYSSSGEVEATGTIISIYSSSGSIIHYFYIFLILALFVGLIFCICCCCKTK